MKQLPLLIMALCTLWTVPGTCYAADPVVCSASIVGGINFGSGIEPQLPGDIDVISSLTYNCTNNTSTTYWVTVCLNIADGPLPVTGGRRQMSGPGGNVGFQIYSNSARTQPWGAVNSTSFPLPVRPADFRLSRNASKTDSIPIYGRLFGGQANATAGNYNATFTYPNVQITGSLQTSNTGGGSCGSSGTDAAGFSAFTVSANYVNSCTVTATDLNFGTQNSSATNISATGNGAVRVTCSKGAPYTIGLKPNSTNSTSGSGTMAGLTSGNTDAVPYQLYSNAALSVAWGDAPGSNTVAATGTGAVQPAVTIYGKVPSANFSSDSYADTVTVNVRY